MAKGMYNERKLRELILHVAWRSQDDPHCGAVKLNKLLFYSDFMAYRRFGRPITGAEYEKRDHGPVPRNMKTLVEKMCLNGDLVIQVGEVWGREQKRAIPLRPADLGEFTAEEIALVDSVITACRKKNARGISNMSHRFRGWKLASFGETIPYGVAMVVRRKPTEAERQHGRALEEKAKALLAS